MPSNQRFGLSDLARFFPHAFDARADDPAFLDDELDLAQPRDILQWITRDRDQVRQFARLYRSNLARRTSFTCGEVCRITLNFVALQWHHYGMTRSNSDLSLFEPVATVPEGFLYRPNFLSESEEHSLIAEIRELELAPFKYYQFTGKRRTASFGWEYEFGERDIRAAAEIPSFLLPFRTRVATLFDVDPESLRQASVIEYSPGSPIGWHRDIPHFGVVFGISLGSSCRMRFRKYSRGRSKTNREVLSIELQPRSIYLMSGASRESWQHSIPPVKELRYAIMMRTVRP